MFARSSQSIKIVPMYKSVKIVKIDLINIDQSMKTSTDFIDWFLSVSIFID